MIGMIAAAGMGAAVPAAAEARTPPPIWHDVRQVNILCLVETEHGVDDDALHRRVCETARAAAAEGAAVPVRTVGTGDPAILRHDSVTLLVHGRARPEAGGRLFALSVRPYRNDGNDPGLLFAAAPRAAAYRDEQDRALAALVRDGVRAVLPWA